MRERGHKMAEKKANPKNKHLFLRGNVWWIQALRDGVRVVQSTGETSVEAARLERDRVLNPMNLKDEVDRAQAVLERVRTKEGAYKEAVEKRADEETVVLLADAWELYLRQHNRPDTGASTLAVYEGQINAFVAWMGDKYAKVLDLREVTQEHADEYAGHLLGSLSSSTFNRHVNLLTLVWRVLEKAARLRLNPWRAIGRKRSIVHSRRELTVDELKSVCEAAQGEMRVLIALGIYCGLRLGDAACLDWSNVDMARRTISLVPRKTARREQKRITVPMHPALYGMLAETSADRRRGFVMPGLEARYKSFDGALAKDVASLFLSVDIKTNPNKLTKSEKDAAKAAAEEEAKKGETGRRKRPKRKPKPKGDRVRSDCGFHSLRHTFVSLCAAGGVPQSVVQSLVGHGSPAMTQHYTHIALETAQKAVATLPDVTHAEGLPERANATEAEMAEVERVLGLLTLAQLEKVAAKVKALAKGLRGPARDAIAV